LGRLPGRIPAARGACGCELRTGVPGMSVYAHAPAPKRPADARLGADEEQAPTKRPKPDVAEGLPPSTGAVEEGHTSQNRDSSGPAQEPVTARAAMQKLAGHIGSSTKFPKASKLARQLLRSNAVTPETVDDFFSILESAMAAGTHVNDPSLRGGYRELILDAMSCPCFSPGQRQHLEVWHIRAVVCNSLFTDDSYEFSRAANVVKDLITALPERPPSDDDVDKDVRETGIDAITQCVEVAYSRYSMPWARTTVDILVNEAKEHIERFTEACQKRLLDIWSKVKLASQKRKQASKEVKGDSNSFEQMRSKWESAAVSIRSAVGSEGDHKSELKLG